MRQSLFDVLGQRCDGLAVLDLFAGSGALGLEAVSRGAARAVLVEQGRPALAALAHNLETLGFGDRATVVPGDALNLAGLAGALGPFDLVLADPPYALGMAKVLAAVAATPGLLGEAARVVVEHARRDPAPERVGTLLHRDTRRYGDTMVSFYTAQGATT